MWNDIIRELFAIAVPVQARWQSLDEIVAVLNAIGAKPNGNHTFQPGEGGLDLTGASTSREAGCIEMHFEGVFVTIVKPTELTFEFISREPEMSYFRLETASLEPSAVCEDSTIDYEELTELSDGRYVHRNVMDSDEKPDGARAVGRQSHGTFAIFCKSSRYNYESSTYDARHNKMTSKEFRAYIERQVT
jgi:serine/threonine-protein kinase